MKRNGAWPEEIVLVGRLWTMEELGHIEEVIRMFPKLSHRELALTLCETLEWHAPNGKPKLESCLALLRKLEANGWVNLPKEKHPMARTHSRKETITVSTATEPETELGASVSTHSPIELEPVRKREEIRLWNEYIERYHMLGYKRPFGAHQRYFIWSRSLNRRLGCMLFAASAWALAERDAWIGWNKQDRAQRLHLIVNNTRFLIFPWVKVRNLASKALSLATKQVPVDWRNRYGFEPALLETFVDMAHYQGTCYQAANWVLLGETRGRGRMDRYTQHLSSPKHIYVYPLRRDFRALLCGESGGAQ